MSQLVPVCRLETEAKRCWGWNGDHLYGSYQFWWVPYLNAALQLPARAMVNVAWGWGWGAAMGRQSNHNCHLAACMWKDATQVAPWAPRYIWQWGYVAVGATEPAVGIGLSPSLLPKTSGEDNLWADHFIWRGGFRKGEIILMNLLWHQDHQERAFSRCHHWKTEEWW